MAKKGEGKLPKEVKMSSQSGVDYEESMDDQRKTKEDVHFCCQTPASIRDRKFSHDQLLSGDHISTPLAYLMN